MVGAHSAILAPNHDLNDATSAARGASPRNKSDRKLPPGRADSALPVGPSGGGVGARRGPRTTNCPAFIGNDCKCPSRCSSIDFLNMCTRRGNISRRKTHKSVGSIVLPYDSVAVSIGPLDFLVRRTLIRQSRTCACNATLSTLCGILTHGALWEHERSVAVAAPTAVSSGLVHLVGLQSRHTAQKGR